MLELIAPDWPAPPRVRACCTTRRGGRSDGIYAHFNLGLHVGDDPAAVAANRAQLRQALALDREPCWLTQVHGTAVVAAAAAPAAAKADAACTSTRGVACAILTADCLPILLCDEAGTSVAAIHAGWRGLCKDVIGPAVAALPVASEALLAWIGPGIGAEAYAVGAPLRAQFCAVDPAYAAFFRGAGDAWHADLAGIAEWRLRRAGVWRIFRYRGCTYRERARFYSYRRDGQTGRMASLIWLT